MEHKTLDEIAKVAHVLNQTRDDGRARRRQRLEKLAAILDDHRGPIRLLSRIEYLPRDRCLALRQDESPLTIAYQDQSFRQQGLNGDQLGHAMAFFGLSLREAHEIFCDCHYTGMITPEKVARRVRSLARKMTIGEMWGKARGVIATQWHRMAAAN
jgi:hypothetical protein